MRSGTTPACCPRPSTSPRDRCRPCRARRPPSASRLTLAGTSPRTRRRGRRCDDAALGPSRRWPALCRAPASRATASGTSTATQAGHGGRLRGVLSGGVATVSCPSAASCEALGTQSALAIHGSTEASRRSVLFAQRGGVPVVRTWRALCGGELCRHRGAAHVVVGVPKDRRSNTRTAHERRLRLADVLHGRRRRRRGDRVERRAGRTAGHGPAVFERGVLRRCLLHGREQQRRRRGLQERRMAATPRRRPEPLDVGDVRLGDVLRGSGRLQASAAVQQRGLVEAERRGGGPAATCAAIPRSPVRPRGSASRWTPTGRSCLRQRRQAVLAPGRHVQRSAHRGVVRCRRMVRRRRRAGPGAHLPRIGGRAHLVATAAHRRLSPHGGLLHPAGSAWRRTTTAVR